MNLFSLFRKRNYIYFYHIVKPYTSSVIKRKSEYDNYDSLTSICDYFQIAQYKKITVVASGPSATKLNLDDDTLYFCCNDSINIVDSKPHVYVVHDNFYLVKYLKSFKGTEKWKGTIFWIFNNNSQTNYISFKKVYNYITSKSRSKREFLITNFNFCKSSESLNSELFLTLQKEFDFTYKSINSGFNTLLIASVLAFKANKSLEVYGFDMGEGGDQYYNKSAFIGKSIKGEENKKIVSEFLRNLYLKKMKINNESNFMTFKSKQLD